MNSETSYDNLPADDHASDESGAALNQPVTEIDSGVLLQGSREILIRHHDQIYRLRLTRNDKLILHK